ncbi:reductive dehalogenase [Desulforhopalus singaporensis]|uniref:Reductive dehalogenase n=1 Tax=Desulforhopalus singaporensis TaxID=91360 RepID=A0A1H0RXW0_9BACT|nr:reductive dehalogenase [Desulforhopalus singaporensis]SDP34273.1 reductive dehalogenase [Desulforhopalus singaporensis]
MKQEEKDTMRFDRRQFGKIIGGLGVAAAGMALGSAQLGHAEEKNPVTGRMVQPVPDGPHQVDTARYQRFNGKNMAFNINSRELGENWLTVMKKNAVANIKKGYGAKEIQLGSPAKARSEAAFFLALDRMNEITGTHGENMENKEALSWNSDHDFPLPPTQRDPEILTQQVKLMARLAGADLVGICRLDRRWIYSEVQRNGLSSGPAITKEIVFKGRKPKETERQLIIPEDCRYAIVMAFAQNRRMVQTSPSMLSMAATFQGYSRMGFATITLAEYIRMEGYTALPCKNDTGLSVPMAVDAGLGEVGRHSILITPEFGPNVRLAKVITNMPLIPDNPIEFGVQEFCKSCKKCARECPSKSITEGDKGWEGKSECNNAGVFKYHNDLKKCHLYWVENGSSCMNCVAVCPFTKGAMVTHDITRNLINHAPWMNSIWLNLDDTFGYGEPRSHREIMEMQTGSYGLDPRHFERTVG